MAKASSNPWADRVEWTVVSIKVRNRHALLLSAWIWLLAPLPRCWAQISLTLSAEVQPTPPQPKVRLSVSNQGKEEAHNVGIRLENGAAKTLPGEPVLLPNASFDTATELNVQNLSPGRHPLLLTVSYTDRNGYPFSAIFCTTFVVEKDTSSDLFGTLAVDALASRSVMHLKLKNLAGTERSARLRLFTPKELSVDNPVRNIRLAPKEEKQVEAWLRNFSALPGSLYPLFAILEYDEGGQHYSHTIEGQVQIVAQAGFFERFRFWILGVAAGLLILGTVVAATRLYSDSRRKRMRAAADEKR
ncbi:MAG: hypothetical protein ACE5JX_01940 [Acidobacteriota bacterium]